MPSWGVRSPWKSPRILVTLSKKYLNLSKSKHLWKPLDFFLWVVFFWIFCKKKWAKLPRNLYSKALLFTKLYLKCLSKRQEIHDLKNCPPQHLRKIHNNPYMDVRGCNMQRLQRTRHNWRVFSLIAVRWYLLREGNISDPKISSEKHTYCQPQISNYILWK